MVNELFVRIIRDITLNSFSHVPAGTLGLVTSENIDGSLMVKFRGPNGYDVEVVVEGTSYKIEN